MLGNALKIMQTLAWMKLHTKKAISYKELFDFIRTTWGDEILGKLRSGETDLEEYLTWLEMPDADKEKWRFRYRAFVERLKQKNDATRGKT